MNDTTEQAPPPPPPSPPPGPAPHGPQPQPDEGRWRSENLSDYRSLRRAHDDRKIGGVAGGLARHLDVDPTIVRVLLVVSVFFGGAGLLVYAALWLVVPDEVTGRSAISVRDSTRNVVVVAVLVLAVFLGLGDTFDGGSPSWPPLVVIAVVTLVWLTARDRRREQAPADTGQVAGVAPGRTGAAYLPAPARYVPVPAARRPRRHGPLLFLPTLALAVVALGVLGLVEATGVEVADGAYPALALAVVGAALVLGSVLGRPGGLVLLGLVACLALAVVSVTQPRFDGDRDLRVAPTTAAGLADAYEVPAGRIEVDLSRVDDLDALDGRSLDLSANAGELVLVVPRGLTVDLDAAVAYGGAVDWPDGTRGGWDFGLDRRVGDADDPTITVDADLRFGHIELRQS